MKRAYNEVVADEIRELLVDDKLCVCVNQDDLLCRIGNEQAIRELENGTCRQMTMNGRASKDFVLFILKGVNRVGCCGFIGLKADG